MSGPLAAPLCLLPRPMSHAPRVLLPANSVDCHFHVFRHGAALVTPRDYTPRDTSLAEWQAYGVLAGISRGVLIQPSVYGFDNSVMLDTVAQSPQRLRAIAVIDPAIPDDELTQMHSAGVRGVRCNLHHQAGLGLDATEVLARRIAPLGWSLQFQVRPEQIETLAEIAPHLGLPIVIDHFGFVHLENVETALERLRRLLDAGDCYLKLSAAYRLAAAPVAAMAALVTGLVETHGDRLLWGSDWPHPGLWSDMPDDAELIDELMASLNDTALRRTLFVDTPARLFFQD